MIFTLASASPVSVSANPKSPAANVWDPSSASVTVLLAPVGASFAAVTSTVMV